MEMLIFPSFVTVVIIISFIIAMKKRNSIKLLIPEIIFAVIMILVYGGDFLDLIFCIGSHTQFYNLPSRIGHISEIRIKKDGVPSELILNGEVYKIDKYLISDRNFKTKDNYKVTYTPITKTVIDIAKN